MIFKLLLLLTLSTSFCTYAGLDQQEKDDFEHLTVGADVFPYDWWLRLKSARAKDISGNWNTYLKENITERTSALYDEDKSKYLSEVIGLSVAWSGSGSMNPNALKTDAEVSVTKIGEKAPIRFINGVPSIRMLGTNCAACHTGNLRTDTKNYIIPGGQANLSLEWLLKDMMISTVGLLFNVDNQLTEFLVSFGYSQTEGEELAKKFKKDTMKALKLSTTLKLAAKQLKIIATQPTHTFVKEEKTIGERLKALLRLTLHLGENDQLGLELEKRMGFIAMLVSGTPRKTYEDHKWNKYLEVVAGYGRVDAFNNAFNKLLRDKNEKVSLTAPVGYPPIWGIQNKYLIHYTGNTNSVVNRNIGVSIAAGAIILNDKYDSTINFDNLFKFENLIYKIDPPNWEKMFHEEKAKVFKINVARVERGQELFQNNCIKCHSPIKTHNQYKLPLYEYPLLSQEKLGTDPNLSIKIVKPLHPLKDYQSFPAETYLKTTQSLLDRFFEKYNVDEKRQIDYSFHEYRGKQWFKNVKVDKPNSSYVARDLAGIWATAPFLHNNSVPTLWDLLQKPESRPKIFRVKDRKFDAEKVGLKDYENDLKGCEPKNAYDYKTDFQQCIDTKIAGSSNAGHNFGTNLSDEDKYDLIEYLKVIKPYAETRAPSSTDGKANSETPFLDEFDNIKLGKLPLVGKKLAKKDLLRHKLLTFRKWTVDYPRQMFEELRTHRPVAQVSSMPIRQFGAENTGITILSKSEDIFEVLGNPAIFSVRHVGYKLDTLGGHMLGTDQTSFNTVEKPWLRKLMPESDYGRIFGLIGRYTQESFELIEQKQKGAQTYKINLVSELGRRVPALLFEKYFGFSGETLEQLYKWSYWIQWDTFRNPTNRKKIRNEAVKVELELLAIMNKHIDKLEIELKKNGDKPINDTILERMLLSEEVKSGLISKERIALNMIGMLGASIDTIQIALLKSLEFFIMNPEILNEAKAVAQAATKSRDPKEARKLQKYVMESLRLRPATPVLIRYTESDQVIAKGTPRETLITKGTSVILGSFSAMRDPDFIPDAEKFDINRPESAYLLFGYGHHKCLGDRLAEVELSILMSAILQKTNIKYFNNDKPNMTFPEDRILEYDAKL